MVGPSPQTRRRSLSRLRLCVGIVVGLFSVTLIILSLVFAVLREVFRTSPLINPAPPVPLVCRWFESLTITCCWLGTAPLATLPYIFANSGDVGGMFHDGGGGGSGGTGNGGGQGNQSGTKARKATFAIVAFGAVVVAIIIFVFVTVFQAVYYDLGDGRGGFPEGSREAMLMCGTIIFGIGVFLMYEVVVDGLYGFGPPRKMPSRDRIFQRNKMSVNTEYKAALSVTEDFLQKNRGSLFPLATLRTVLEHSPDVELENPSNAALIRILRCIRDVYFREHQRTHQRVYGVLVAPKEGARGSISSRVVKKMDMLHVEDVEEPAVAVVVRKPSIRVKKKPRRGGGASRADE